MRVFLEDVQSSFNQDMLLDIVDDIALRIRGEFKIQKNLLEALPAEQQVRDVIVGTVARAVDKVLVAGKGNFALSSTRGGICVLSDDGEKPKTFVKFYDTVPSNPRETVEGLVEIIQNILINYELDIKKLTSSIKNAEYKVPEGYGNDKLNHRKVIGHAAPEINGNKCIL